MHPHLNYNISSHITILFYHVSYFDIEYGHKKGIFDIWSVSTGKCLTCILTQRSDGQRYVHPLHILTPERWTGGARWLGLCGQWWCHPPPPSPSAYPPWTWWHLHWPSELKKKKKNSNKKRKLVGRGKMKRTIPPRYKYLHSYDCAQLKTHFFKVAYTSAIYALRF